MIDGNVKNILREKLALEIEISFSAIVQYLSSYIPKKKNKRKEMLSFWNNTFTQRTERCCHLLD